jgi:hypothetical protein
MVMNMTLGLASELALGVARSPKIKAHRAKTNKQTQPLPIRAPWKWLFTDLALSPDGDEEESRQFKSYFTAEAMPCVERSRGESLLHGKYINIKRLRSGGRKN